MVEFKERHPVTALAPKRVIAERKHKLNPEAERRFDEGDFFLRNSHKEFVGVFVMFSVDTVIADHFEMFVGNVND